MIERLVNLSAIAFDNSGRVTYGVDMAYRKAIPSLPRLWRGAQRRARESAERAEALIRRISGAGNASPQLLIYDNIFPSLLSGFRLAEFHAYLDAYPGAEVWSSGEDIPNLEPGANFRSALRDYSRLFPQYRARIKRSNRFRSLKAELVYTIFSYNAYSIVESLDAQGVPFAFGLYPAGGFRLHDERSDRMLRRITSSPNLRGIITTQRTTQRYVLERGFCAPDKVHFVFGVPVPDFRSAPTAARRRWKQDKRTLDVCFVAQKYMPQGRDKGYDVFVEVARRLMRIEPQIRFHVVGPYDPSDVDITGIEGKIEFYGAKNGEFFKLFYPNMDLIISPNSPFLLGPGAFDGFPLSCSAEAALCGVAVCACDELKENGSFVDGREIIIIPPDPARIAEILQPYIVDYDKLIRLASEGQKKFTSIYSREQQIEPRLRILSQCRTSPIV